MRKATLTAALIVMLLGTGPAAPQERESRPPASFTYAWTNVQAKWTDGYATKQGAKPNGTWTVARKLGTLAGEKAVFLQCTISTWDGDDSCGSGTVKVVGKIAGKTVLKGKDPYSKDFCDTWGSVWNQGAQIDLSAHSADDEFTCTIKVLRSKQVLSGNRQVSVTATLWIRPDQAAARAGASAGLPLDPHRGEAEQQDR